MEEYKPLFQSYLDIQKQINIEDLDERELKGRWKSFVGRWYVIPVDPKTSKKKRMLT